MRRWLVDVAFLLGLTACGSVGTGTDAGVSCAVGELSCGGACVDPLSDNAHCGACDRGCATGEVCGNGTCGTSCPVEQLECGGSCVDPQTDFEHCGDCETACEAGEECRGGTCEVPCADGLVAPATEDSFGLVWDGLERTATTLAQATVDCESFGGRLPTATEVHRASAQQSGDVGETFDTAPLWTQVPADELTQVASRLSDGAASEVAASAATAYRCVCAPPGPPLFSGQRCSGPASAPCVAVGERNMDARDRPAMRHSSALWECAHDLGHVADPTTLIEASYAGVTGSNAFLQTSDRWRYDLVTTVRWSGTTPWTATYGAGGTHFYVAPSTAMPFRCVGPRTAVGVHPNSIAGTLAPEITGYTLDDSDRAAVPWVMAHDACTAAGGHLARSAELVEGLYAGLGNGSGTNLWTSDSCGYQSDANFRVATVRWVARSERFPYVYAGGATSPITWEYKHTNDSPYRCVYYPLDAEYVAPTTCAGGCFELTLGGATPARAWFDTLDRPAATFAAAIAACAAEGGHLASERDLTEAIRGGLPNGTNSYVWAADIGQALSMVVKWTAVEPGFTDLYLGTGSPMTWDYPTMSRPYRCAWTNELR
ncbi:MAG: hypothetical protein R2939_05650 [Kofleriaceae bacterium]